MGKNMGKKITKIVSLMLAIMTVMSLIACIPVKVDAKDKAEMTAEPEPEPITEPEPTAEPVSPLIPMQEIKPEPAAEVAPEINPAGTETTEPVATETPAEPVDPNAAHKNTDAEIEAIAVDYCKNRYDGGYKADRLKTAFMYATMPKAEDFTKKITDDIKEPYLGVPYNMYVPDLGNNPSKFQTYKELVDEIGKDKAKKYVDKAWQFADCIGSNYPEEMNSETLEKQFVKRCGLPEDKAHQYAEQKLAFYRAYMYNRESWIAYENDLIYRDVEGIIRVRIEYNLILREASEDYLEHSGATRDEIDQWIGTYAEIKVFTDAEGNITDYEMIPLGDMLIRDDTAQKKLTRLFDNAG